MREDYDDMTPAEQAEIDVERYVHDLDATLSQLSRWRFSPLHAPYYAQNEERLHSSLTSLQLLVSTLEADRKAFQRPARNVIPIFLSKREAVS